MGKKLFFFFVSYVFNVVENDVFDIIGGDDIVWDFYCLFECDVFGLFLCFGSIVCKDVIGDDKVIVVYRVFVLISECIVLICIVLRLFLLIFSGWLIRFLMLCVSVSVLRL